MSLATCSYHRPQTLEEACELLQRYPDARPLAGGTDLLVQIRASTIPVQHVVDVKQLGLDYIRPEPGRLTIGATTRHADLAGHSEVQRDWPALAAACRAVGGPPTRNRGTLGGNLVNASPVADTVPALMIYDSVVEIRGPKGHRLVPLAEFFTGYRSTVLEPGEIVVQLTLARPQVGSASLFRKSGGRRALYIASVNVAIRVDVGPTAAVSCARVALGSVAPTSVLSPAASLLVGRRLDRDQIEKVANAVARGVAPISDVRSEAWHRSRLVEVMVRRGLSDIQQRLDPKEASHG